MAKPKKKLDLTPKEPRPATEAIMELRAHLDQMLGGLTTNRFSWWTHWREISEYLIPRRYKWLITPNQGNRGSPINQRIIDNTGTRALRILTSGMVSGLTNPVRPWFNFTLHDTDLAQFPAVKMWLDEVTSRMRYVLAESNFYTSIGTFNEDLGAFGTGAMLLYDDFDDVVRFYNSCLGEYFLANSKRMTVDTFYRTFVQTTQQVASEFGVENCSMDVQRAIQLKGAGLTREVIVAHGVEPNDELTDKMPGMKDKAFREAYWQWGQGRNLILRVRGYHENPAIVARWSIVGNDAYGRSPGMDALGDLKQLQVEQKRKMQAIDKQVNPPMMFDVSLKNEPASVIPGGVTWADLSNNKVGAKPIYQVMPQIQEMVKDIQECQGRINTTFFTDLFMMLENLEGVQPRNQLEIIERKGEKIVQIGPMVERFENEALDPALERCFNIMWRAGLFPPAPKELRGQHLKIDYVSMLAQAQKAAMTAGVEQFASFVGRMLAANPEIGDNVDWDEMVEVYGEYLDIPANIVKPYADVLKIRAARAQAQQAQAAMQNSLAAVQGAKTLADTPVGQGGSTALDQLLGQGQPA